MSEIQLKKNQAAEIMFAMVDSATPANLKSGLTVTDDPYYKDDAGAWTSLAITDASTEIGSTGMYTLEMTAAELNHDLILIKLTGSGAADTIIVIRTFTNDIDDVNIVVPDAAGIAPTAAEIKTEIEQSGSSIASILEDTGDLQANQGAWATATGFATATICTEARLVELDAANIPSDLSTIDTVVDGIQTDLDNTTDGLGALKALIDTIDGIVDAILLDTGTDGVVVAAGSKTGYALTDAGVDAILDEVVEGSLTLRQIQRITLAVLAGKSAGGGTTTLTFKDVADAKARVTATVDATGNRTAITNDGT